LKKIGIVVMAGLIVLAFSSMVMGEEMEKPSLQAASIGVKEAIRSEPVNAVRTTMTFIDWGAVLLEKILSTGNAYLEFDSINQAWPGVEVTIWDVADTPLEFTVGWTKFDDNGHWTFGVKLDQFPLFGQWSDIFKKFQPGLCVVNGQYKLTLRYEFRD